MDQRIHSHFPKKSIDTISATRKINIFGFKNSDRYIISLIGRFRNTSIQRHMKQKKKKSASIFFCLFIFLRSKIQIEEKSISILFFTIHWSNNNFFFLFYFCPRLYWIEKKTNLIHELLKWNWPNNLKKYKILSHTNIWTYIYCTENRIKNDLMNILCV